MSEYLSEPKSLDILDIDKLKKVRTNLRALKSKVDKLDVDKLDVHNAKIKNIEDKILDITNVATTTTLNAKNMSISY